MATIASNGHDAWVVETGDGPPLVLVHGLGGTAASWRHVAPHLADVARVIAYDVRGAGGSETTPGPYTLDLLADDLGALLDTLGLTTAVVAGHSMGATIALLAASRQPERIAGVIAIGTAFEPADQAARAGLAGLADTVEEHGMGAVAESLATFGTSPTFAVEEPERFRDLVDGLRATDPAGFAARARALGTFAAGRHLSEPRMPVLVLAAQADPLSPMAANKLLTASLANAALISLDDDRHESPAAQPELLAGEIRRFLGRIIEDAPS